jgi:hypothetical protein
MLKVEHNAGPFRARSAVAAGSETAYRPFGMGQAGEPPDQLAERKPGQARPIDMLWRFPLPEGWAAKAQSILGELGYSVREVLDEDFRPSPESSLWITASPSWYPRALRRLASVPPSRRPAVLVWHSEPLPPAKAMGLPRPRLHAREVAKIALRDRRATDPYTNSEELRWLAAHGLPDVLVVSSDDKRAFLEERGISAEVVPLGYHPSYGEDLGLERDIDVLFLGALDVPRRRRALRRLRSAGVNVVAVGDWQDPRFWGDSRVALLNRARIVLNISRNPGQFSGQRLILAAANGALAVSEPMARPAPWVPGEHYVSARLEDFPTAIVHYLSQEEERRRIAARARAFVTQELTLERAITRVLALVEARAG